MAETMTMRLARPTDAAGVQAIYAPYVENTVISFEETLPDVAVMRSRIESTITHYPYIILESSSAIAGYAYASALRTRIAYQWSAELSIYIHPDQAGKGFGPRLYSALLSLLHAQKFCTAYGCLAIPNQASERLHERLGFSRVGLWHRCGYKRGQWLDVGWFEKILSDSPDHPAPVIPLPQLKQEIISDILR